MSGYVPRPGAGERRIVRRSLVTKEVSRGRPRGIVRRRRPTVGRRSARRQTLRAACRAAAWPLRSLAAVPGRRMVLALMLAGLVAALAGTGTWIWRSSTFEIKNLEVVGTSLVPAETVAATADLRGRHMLTADLGAAQRRITALPLVRSARIERRWPDTVLIEVAERSVWGTWEQAGVRYAIDREGVVLGTFNVDRSLPYVVSAEPTTLRQGDRVSYQAVDAVAAIYELLPAALGTDVAEVAFVPGKGVQVSTADGQVAILGDSSSIRYKLAVWAAVAEEAARERINYQLIDLRWGNRPVLQ